MELTKDNAVEITLGVVGTIVSLGGATITVAATIDGILFAVTGGHNFHEPILLGMIGSTMVCVGFMFLVFGFGDTSE
jgi:hypothetical protein